MPAALAGAVVASAVGDYVSSVETRKANDKIANQEEVNHRKDRIAKVKEMEAQRSRERGAFRLAEQEGQALQNQQSVTKGITPRDLGGQMSNAILTDQNTYAP